jgi:ABC-2 type transport system permease protein
MKILDLAIKDISQTLRDWKIVLFLVAMPIIFTLFMGFAYRAGGNNDENANTRIVLAVVLPDQTVTSPMDENMQAMLMERLENSNAVRVLAMEQNEALDALQTGEIAGVLVIPAGWGEQAAQGHTSQLQLIAEANSTQGQALYQLLRAPVSQLMSAVEIARISAAAQGESNEFSPAMELAWEKWDAHTKIDTVEVEKVTAKPEADWTGGNPYNQSSPGILVQFTILGLVTSSQVLVQERKTHTLQRLLTTAIHPWEIVAGHLLGMFGLVFMQTALLVIFGQAFLNVDYLSEPVGTLLISICLGLWIAAMGMLIGMLANTDDQVVLYSMVAMFIFSALGGAWFPLEGSGSLFASIGKLTPTAWAMSGYQNFLIRGLGLDSAWLPAGILLVYAVLFFGLAVWKFRRADLQA